MFLRNSFRFFNIFFVTIVLLSSLVAAPEVDLMPLQGTTNLGTNLIVEIWTAPTGGNVIYNSTNDFLNRISGGSSFDIVLGNGTQTLDLIYGTKYYMEMYIDGNDLDFNGSERQVFMSSIGNLTDVDVDDNLTINTTSTIQTRNNDPDDALNVSDGGASIFGKLQVAGRGFNVSSAGNLITNGTVTGHGVTLLTNSDADDALNASGGGASIFGQLQVAGRGFNVSTAGNLITNGTVTGHGVTLLTNSDADDALNVSAGGANIGGTLKLQGGTLAANITAGQVWIGSSGSALRIASGLLEIFSSGIAANITQGVVSIEGTGNILRIPSGSILSRSTDKDDALNLTGGGGIFNGRVTIADALDNIALSITGGSVIMTPGAVADNINMLEVTDGDVTFSSADVDGALNVSAGGVFVGGDTTHSGKLYVRNSVFELGTVNAIQAKPVFFSGGGNLTLPAVIGLASPNGTPYYLWVNNTGALRISNSDPSGSSLINTEGSSVGSQV